MAESSMTKVQSKKCPDWQYPIFITRGEIKSESSDKPTKIQGDVPWNIHIQYHSKFIEYSHELYIYKW